MLVSLVIILMFMEDIVVSVLRVRFIRFILIITVATLIAAKRNHQFIKYLVT